MWYAMKCKACSGLNADQYLSVSAVPGHYSSFELLLQLCQQTEPAPPVFRKAMEQVSIECFQSDVVGHLLCHIHIGTRNITPKIFGGHAESS
jgi:hypothetical protein